MVWIPPSETWGGKTWVYDPTTERFKTVQEMETLGREGIPYYEAPGVERPVEPPPGVGPSQIYDEATDRVYRRGTPEYERLRQGLPAIGPEPVTLYSQVDPETGDKSYWVVKEGKKFHMGTKEYMEALEGPTVEQIIEARSVEPTVVPAETVVPPGIQPPPGRLLTTREIVEHTKATLEAIPGVTRYPAITREERIRGELERRGVPIFPEEYIGIEEKALLLALKTGERIKEVQYKQPPDVLFPPVKYVPYKEYLGKEIFEAVRDVTADVTVATASLLYVTRQIVKTPEREARALRMVKEDYKQLSGDVATTLAVASVSAGKTIKERPVYAAVYTAAFLAPGLKARPKYEPPTFKRVMEPIPAKTGLETPLKLEKITTVTRRREGVVERLELAEVDRKWQRKLEKYEAAQRKKELQATRSFIKGEAGGYGAPEQRAISRQLEKDLFEPRAMEEPRKIREAIELMEKRDRALLEKMQKQKLDIKIAPLTVIQKEIQKRVKRQVQKQVKAQVYTQKQTQKEIQDALKVRKKVQVKRQVTDITQVQKQVQKQMQQQVQDVVQIQKIVSVEAMEPMRPLKLPKIDWDIKDVTDKKRKKKIKKGVRIAPIGETPKEIKNLVKGVKW